MRVGKSLVLTFCLTALAAPFFAAPALATPATSSWWRLSSTARPANLHGEVGELAITAVNVGDAPVEPEGGDPVVIVDHLPVGLHAIFGREGAHSFGAQLPLAGGECQIPEPREVICTFPSGTVPVFHQIEALIGVRVEAGAESGELNEASISGGGAPSAKAAHPITVNEAHTSFGVEDYEALYEEPGGRPTTAPAHTPSNTRPPST